MEKLDRLCELIGEKAGQAGCEVLKASIYSATYTLRPLEKRVFAQDLAASLNRRGLLPKERYKDFVELATEIMCELEEERVKRLLRAARGD